VNVCKKGLVEGLSIDWAIDLDPEAAAQYAQTYDIPKTSTNMDDALVDESVDAVLIVTPPEAHVPLSIRAMQAGKMVFCEKPLSASPADRAQLRSALAEMPGRLLVGYCYRFAPAYAIAREHVRPAAFSTALVLNHERGGLNYLTHNACHAVDTILSWHDAPVANVIARGADVPSQANPKEQFAILLEFENGSFASITCGGSANGAHMPKWYYKTVGQDGQVAEVSMHPPGWGVWKQGQEQPETCPYYAGHVRELEHLVECVREGKAPANDPENALAVDETIAEARKQLGL
jgi:predicted dehydrogenase